MASSSSSRAPPAVSRDYAAESRAKFPLPAYPDESDYNDPVVYEADCERYKVLKLEVLAKREVWKEREKVADMARAAAAAREKAEEDKRCREAREKALLEANKDSDETATRPAKRRRGVSSSRGESSRAGEESATAPAPGAICQRCAQRSGSRLLFLVPCLPLSV